MDTLDWKGLTRKAELTKLTVVRQAVIVVERNFDGFSRGALVTAVERHRDAVDAVDKECKDAVRKLYTSYGKE